MSVEVVYPHIEKDAGGTARLSRLPRIRVAQIVMDYLSHGWSADEICRQYPHLKPAEVHAALTYYFDHQQEIDQEIADELREIESSASAPRSPFFLRMRASGMI
jgi:uncharacterized protein (DUF433 family)